MACNRRPVRELTAPVALFLAAALCGSAFAGQSALERSETAVGRKVGNYRLVDQNGRFLPFNSLKGRPVLLNFMYTGCRETCPLMNQSIAGLLRKMPPNLSQQITILSVSLDPEEDTPEKLAAYSEPYRKDFGNWRFAAADRETLRLMVSDLGFTYVEKEGEINHMNRITLLDRSGAVSTHIYGANFDPANAERLIRTVAEGGTLKTRVAAAVDRLLLFCSTYDPAKREYILDYKFVAIWTVQYLLAFGSGAALLYYGLLRKPAPTR